MDCQFLATLYIVYIYIKFQQEMFFDIKSTIKKKKYFQTYNINKSNGKERYFDILIFSM